MPSQHRASALLIGGGPRERWLRVLKRRTSVRYTGNTVSEVRILPLSANNPNRRQPVTSPRPFEAINQSSGDRHL